MTARDGGVFGSTFKTEIVAGRMKDKLIAVKEAHARRHRAQIDAQAVAPNTQPGRKRMPPGQHIVQKWPVLDLGHQPAVDKRDWRLRIGGAVANPVDLDWRAFAALPAWEQTADIHCVTNWSLLGSAWRGVPMTAIVDHVRPTPEAKFAIIRSHDAYATNVPAPILLAPDVMLATHWRGEPLSREHGGPVRLLIPALYLWKSAKWVRQIWFTDRDAPGFWEVRGYHALGDPWKEQRYG